MLRRSWRICFAHFLKNVDYIGLKVFPWQTDMCKSCKIVRNWIFPYPVHRNRVSCIQVSDLFETTQDLSVKVLEAMSLDSTLKDTMQQKILLYQNSKDQAADGLFIKLSWAVYHAQQHKWPTWDFPLFPQIGGGQGSSDVLKLKSGQF